MVYNVTLIILNNTSLIFYTYMSIQIAKSLMFDIVGMKRTLLNAIK